MAEDSKTSFAEKAPQLFKELRAKLTFLSKSEGPADDIINLLNGAETDFEKKEYQKSSEKYEEANGKLIKLLRPLAKFLLIIQFCYLAVWLIGAYLPYKFPQWWIWNGIISWGVIAAWYGVLGGITIAIYGIYSHIRKGDFDPRYKLWYICKPVIGGIFGWFVYGLYLVGFISVQEKDVNDIKNPMFIYLISFLAGFSERFILKMIDKLMSVLVSYEETEKGSKEGPAS
jgi:hypothetical protein